MIAKFAEILKSPRFWAAILMIVFVVLGTFVPAVMAKIDQTAVTNAVVALVVFISAETIAGAPSYMAIFGKVRFWSLVVSLGFIFVRALIPAFPISEELLQGLIATLGAASIGTSYRMIGETL